MDQVTVAPALTPGAIIFLLTLALLWGASLAVSIYGIYTAFLKKWYIGVAALLVPGFAMVVGIAKLFKKDILK